jgi:hypothetical protein
MSDSDITEEVEIEEIESGGGKLKRAVAVLGVLAVLVVILKRLGGSSSSGSDEDVESAVERVDEGESDDIDRVSTDDEDEAGDEDEDDSAVEVKTSSARRLSSDRLEDLDVVDYLAIFAAALQAARDEYRIRTER